MQERCSGGVSISCEQAANPAASSIKLSRRRNRTARSPYVSALTSSRLAACQITIGRHDGSVKIVFKLNAHASRPDIIGELDDEHFLNDSMITRFRTDWRRPSGR